MKKKTLLAPLAIAVMSLSSCSGAANALNPTEAATYCFNSLVTTAKKANNFTLNMGIDVKEADLKYTHIIPQKILDSNQTKEKVYDVKLKNSTASLKSEIGGFTLVNTDVKNNSLKSHSVMSDVKISGTVNYTEIPAGLVNNEKNDLVKRTAQLTFDSQKVNINKIESYFNHNIKKDDNTYYGAYINFNDASTAIDSVAKNIKYAVNTGEEAPINEPMKSLQTNLGTLAGLLADDSYRKAYYTCANMPFLPSTFEGALEKFLGYIGKTVADFGDGTLLTDEEKAEWLKSITGFFTIANSNKEVGNLVTMNKTNEGTTFTLEVDATKANKILKDAKEITSDVFTTGTLKAIVSTNANDAISKISIDVSNLKSNEFYVNQHKTEEQITSAKKVAFNNFTGTFTIGLDYDLTYDTVSKTVDDATKNQEGWNEITFE